ncbi:MAG: hypothetical protein MJ145_03720 [Clostridia bacterium]|nr:hypothetical protein [Clostridia bacterium]
MKKLATVLSVMLLSTILFASSAFAADKTFTFVETSPENGETETSIDNMCVKLILEDGVSFKNIGKYSSFFAIKGADGKNFSAKRGNLKVIYSGNEILVMVYDQAKKETTGLAASDTEYTLVVNKNLKDDNGRTFEFDQSLADENGNYSITYTTQNTGRNSIINMVMMALMFGGIFVVSRRSMKKEQEEKEAANAKVKKVNPYEEARRTGKSVEEIVAKENKKKAKIAEIKEKEAEEERKEEEKREARRLKKLEESYHHVKGPKPISEAGGKYIPEDD